MRSMCSWIVRAGLSETVEPRSPPSRLRPQSGGTQDTPDDSQFAANIYLQANGCAWRALVTCFGITWTTSTC